MRVVVSLLLLLLLLLLVSESARADATLNGVSPDHTRYRLSNGHVCDLATVDPQSGVVLYSPGACLPGEPGDGFVRPAKPRLPGGQQIVVRIELETPWPPKVGEVSCLTTKGHPCPSQEEIRASLAFSPRPGRLRILHIGRDKNVTVLAETDGTPRSVSKVFASPDGKRIFVVFTYEKRLRDSPKETPFATEVLGVDVSARWPR